MADYNRMVSYIYSYDNGVKMNNVGFAKLEERNGQLKITMNIKNVTASKERVYKIYIFSGTSNEIKKVHLGDLIIRNNVGEFAGITGSNNILNSHISFKECGGLVICNGTDKAFATVWDDTPIRISDFMKEDKKDANAIPSDTKVEDNTKTDTIGELPTGKIDSNDNLTTAEKSIYEDNNSYNSIDNSALKSSDTNAIKSNDINAIKSSDISTINPNDNEINNYNNNFSNIYVNNYPTNNIEDINILENNKENISDKTTSEYKNIPYKAPWDSSGEAVSVDNAFQNNYEGELNAQYSGSSDSYKSNTSYHTDKGHPSQLSPDELFQRFPKAYPFADDVIIECVKIEPQDIGYLPMEAWVLGNNSFLLHGYYAYKHIILAKMADANSISGYKYILGVPGIYHNREKFMAGMFGFNDFKTVNIREQKTGEFGYWYMDIKL